MAKFRNEEQADRGKKSSGEGSEAEQSRPFHGERGAKGKQQESSANTEKTTCNQPGCKPSHQAPPCHENYARSFRMSINK